MDKTIKNIIIERLKENGFKYMKDFTVSVRFAGTNEIIKVSINDVCINLKTIEKLVKGLQEYETDNYGEILSGGNTFIDVKYKKSKNELFKNSNCLDYDVYFKDIFEEYAYNNFQNQALKIFNEYSQKADNSINKILTNNKIDIIVYFHGINKVIQAVSHDNYNTRLSNRYFTIESIRHTLAEFNLSFYNI